MKEFGSEKYIDSNPLPRQHRLALHQTYILVNYLLQNRRYSTQNLVTISSNRPDLQAGGE